MMHISHQSIVSELNDCSNECNHCFNDFLNVSDINMLSHCIELTRECADFCQMTASLLSRNSVHAYDVMLLCGKICESCAEECEKHQIDQCKHCANVCRTCAESCNDHLAVN